MTTLRHTDGSVVHGFRVGDVVDYRPERRHAREGVAVVNASLNLIDTFWGADNTDPFVTHVLTTEEVASATLRFDPQDFRELTAAEAHSFEEYRPCDRASIPSQHGLRQRLYVRTEATPDHETILANHREKVRAAEQAVVSAERALAWAREDLERAQRRE